MPGKAEIFRSLARSLAGKPGLAAKLRAAEEALALSRAQESGSLVGMTARGALGVIAPSAKAKAELGLAKAYVKARGKDVAIAERAARIPIVGGLFRTQERIPIRTLAKTPQGEVREVLEVPAASLLAPAEKAQKLMVPLLAFMGAEALTRPHGEGEKRMAQPEKYSQVLKVAAVELRQQHKAMEHLADQVIAKEAEAETAKKTADLQKKATDFTVELLRRGLVTADSFSEKIAELVTKGERQLEVEQAALNLVEKRAGLGTAEESSKDEEGAVSGSSWDNNPAIEYLTEYAFNQETVQPSED